MFKLSNNSKNNRRDVDPRLIKISDLAITFTMIDFGHGSTAGKRTAEQQYELYSQGKSKADGYKKSSKHQSGRALDFYAFVDGRASWQRKHLAMVATALLQAANILGYKIKWGGLWRSKGSKLYGWDMPHIQLED